MRRTVWLLVLPLTVPLALRAQHSGSSSQSHASSSGGSGANSHAGSSSSPSSSHGSVSVVSSTTGHPTRGDVRGVGNPIASGPRVRGGDPGPKRPSPGPLEAPARNRKPSHGFFAFHRSPNPVTKPPCRGKDCKPTCPAGQIATQSGCVARRSDSASCSNGYEALGNCGQQVARSCAGPSAGVIAQQELETERLRRARDSACAQAPGSRSCTELTNWYNSAAWRLEQLRREAALCGH